MQVLLTVGLIAAVIAWLFIVARRLARMREEVKLAWKRLQADQGNDAVKSVYNKHVTAYNSALENFPANVIAPFAGFKQAKRY